MNQILEQLGIYGIVPVVVLQDAAKAEPLAEALCKGGLACAEVTFRTDAAEESIRIMSEKFPEMLVGAGTVLTTEQADRAVKAGAKFIVSPGLNPEVVKWCQAHEVPVIPGIVTPTEMEQAIGLGLTMVKFFPAEPAGGLKYIRAIAAPYTMMKFMPTGGINPQNVREYLAYDRIAACGGSWMVKNTMIENNEFDRIEELVKEAVEVVKESYILRSPTSTVQQVVFHCRTRWTMLYLICRCKSGRCCLHKRWSSFLRQASGGCETLLSGSPGRKRERGDASWDGMTY